MKRKVFYLSVAVATVFVLVGCAQKQRSAKDQMLSEVGDDYDMVADITGVDDKTALEVNDSDEEKPTAADNKGPAEVEGDPIGGTQGALVAKIFLDGKESKGTFSVKDISRTGETVAKDVPVGQEIRLNPGLYDLTFRADQVVGKPTFPLQDVEIPAGRRITRDVKIPVGYITLTTGGSCVKKPIRVKPTGADDWYPGKFSTCTEMMLLSGTYEAVMGDPGRGGIPISGIQVYDGGKRDVLIRKE